ncbi:MAG TPA: excinuclease ABC subunit C [Acidobacteriaceae bacterium]
MSAPFHFEHSVAFSPEKAPEILRAISTLPGVFALHGPRVEDQPYLTRAADLRRRITRMLAPPDSQSKRLNLRDRVARIDYTITGSEFESTLTLYHASAALFGLDEARRRLRLRTPFFLRFTAENAYPRVYSTNRLSKRALDNFYGPFPSRAAADRYCDAVLDLFKLRRCVEDLAPYPEHPGCVYQEMKKCLAPCNQACTPEGAAAYTAEATAVHAFFDTHGESMLAQLTAEREAASVELDFERAARVHAQWQKVKAAASLADELVQPIPKLRAIIIQKAVPSSQEVVILSGAKDPRILPEAPQSFATPEAEPAAAVFMLQSGCITGPEHLSTLGVRAVKEQTSVGSSLFAQPLMLEAIPLANDTQSTTPTSEAGAPRLASETWVDATESQPTAAALSPELRATNLIATLEQQASAPTDLATLSDHLSLLRRWYYRPEKQRVGEVFFPREDAADRTWPIRRILNGAARAAFGDPKPMAETHRDLATRNPADEAQKPTRTKVLHEGRPDVERAVPVPDKPPAFKSRRTARPSKPEEEPQIGPK